VNFIFTSLDLEMSLIIFIHPAFSIQNLKGRAPRACTWVNVKGKAFRSFLNNIYPALRKFNIEPRAVL